MHKAHHSHSHVIEPHPEKLYVVTVISNPARFKSRYRLYHSFAKHMEDSGAILYTVEMAFGDRPFEITSPDNPRHIQVRSKHELWHKENLLNIGISRLPPDAKYIAWIDADIQFTRSDWVQETIHQLQHYDVVQMFSHAVYLGPEYEVIKTSLGWIESMKQGLSKRKLIDCGSDYEPISKARQGAWHSGFAWAATRKALDICGGLLDFAILGSADRHMAAAFFGEVLQSCPHDITPSYREHLLRWQTRALKLRHNIGQVNGTVTHAFHGKRADRRYNQRWKVLVEHKYSPFTDIKKDSQGLYQFHDDGSLRFVKLRNGIKDYFRARNEDSVDL